MRIRGARRLAVVAALAAGLVLALAAMPGCGSDCPTPEQQIYLNEVENWTERSRAGLADFQTIVYEGGNRPELILDEGWRGRLKRVLDEMNNGHEQMMNVEPPSGTQDVHRTVVRVAETAIEANELLWQGVLDVDAELMSNAIPKIEEATRLLIEELLPAVERFCE